MNKSFTLLLLACIALLAALFACSDSDGCSSSGVVKSSNVIRDSFVDVRDGQVYKTVKIGNQVWMAENLNFETPREDRTYRGGLNNAEIRHYQRETSFCYDKYLSNCTRFGRLYSWSEAMDGKGHFSKNAEGCGDGKTCAPIFPVQGVCPVGWHLPTKAEWDTLLLSIIGGVDVAGRNLKSRKGWRCHGNGRDAYGFSALPAGQKLIDGIYDKFDSVDRNTAFWSSTEQDTKSVFSAYLSYDEDKVNLTANLKNLGLSVRCVQDRRENGSSAIADSVVSAVIPHSVAELSSSSSWRDKVPIESMKDSRDGQKYKTVTIGSQTWMAENLKYKTANSFCFNDSARNCSKYGRYYAWSAAKKACPAGWLLPTREDWKTLISFVGGPFMGGKMLKTSEGWHIINGTDDYGFSAFPTGYMSENGLYRGGNARFWSSSQDSLSREYYLSLYNHDGRVKIQSTHAKMWIPVRCIKDRRETKDESREKNVFSDTALAVIPHPVAESASSSSWRDKVPIGSIIDSRDGHIYKTINVGNQTWMAENLNYKIPGSFCHENDTSCSKLGRTYLWKTAKNVCPAGYRLPTLKELVSAIRAAKSDSLIGEKFNSKFKSFWTSTEYDNDSNMCCVRYKKIMRHDRYAYYRDYDNRLPDEGFFADYCRKDKDLYVRCVKDRRENGPSVLQTRDERYVRREGDAVSPVTDSSSVTPATALAVIPHSVAESSSSSRVSLSSASVSSWSVIDSQSLSMPLAPDLFRGIGSITDSRDGQTYKTVNIGHQTWMAENLNYKTANSYCFADKESNCDKYGRLYTWAAAIDSAGSFIKKGWKCGYGNTCELWDDVQGACPEGWHLPTWMEWKYLISAIGGKDSLGKKLKTATGWYNNGNGTDDFGFSALPAGFKFANGNYSHEGRYALFWSSWNFHKNTDAYVMFLRYYKGYVVLDDESVDERKNMGASVRCVKDLVYDTITDSRDGHKYRAVKIDSQIWMAENLNYKTPNSFCYEDADSNCTKYGRLYTWEAAENVCPAGWHLPTVDEWIKLIVIAGGLDDAYYSLSSKHGTGWEKCDIFVGCMETGGLDKYGFSVLPAGGRWPSNFDKSSFYYTGEGRETFFWSSTSDNEVFANCVTLGGDYFRSFAQIRQLNKNSGFSVRCVRD